MTSRAASLLAVVSAAAASCQSPAASPRAAADRISSRSQLIGGPKALGEIGDYLLENDKIRVIVGSAGDGRGSMPFGGAIIDADLVRPQGGAGRGSDQLGEVIPSYLLETLEPVDIRVTADGKDGGPAIVTVEGVGGNMLQMLTILNTGLLYSPELRFREEYKLSPGASYVEITSSITNEGAAAHPLPYLNPTELGDLGLDIPGLDALQLSVPLGHLLLFGAENPMFTPGAAGFDLRFAIEDAYASASGFPAFPGIVVDYLASRGHGVSYGFAAAAAPDNYPWTYRDLYGPGTTDHSLVIPYLYSSVTGAYHANPPAVLGAGETFSYTSYLIVGKGDAASILSVVQELQGVATGTFAGKVLDARSGAPVVHASIVVQDAAWRYVTQIDTDDNGAFRATLPPGDYVYRVVTNVRPTTAPAAIHIDEGRLTSERIQLDPPGALAVQVVGDDGRRLPCKVTLVGRFADERRGQLPWTFLYDLALGEKLRPTTMDPTSSEYIEAVWSSSDGLLAAEARPGVYDLVVSRGIEYEIDRQEIELRAGETTLRQITLRRAFDTAGYISADLHVHSGNSIDSEIPLRERVISIAGEGLDYVAATDHNFVTDYGPAIAELGLFDWLSAAVGMELSTLEMGHVNGYPLRVDAGRVRGGDFSWVGKTPDGLFDELRGLGARPEDVIIQVNHPRDGVLGYFTQFNVNVESSEVAPREGLRAIFAPFTPEFAPDAFSYDFDAYEVLNGKRQDIVHHFRDSSGQVVRTAQGTVAFPGQVEDWLALLSHGLEYTGVGNSDSHKALGQEPGYPRNMIWVGEGRDEQGQFSEADVVAGIRSHRVIMTNGPLVELTVDGAPIGSRVAVGAEARVELRVRSAGFAPFDRVTVYVNDQVNRVLSVPADERTDFAAAFTLDLAADAFVVIEVTGDTSLFPVVPPQELEPMDVGTVIDALGAGLDLSGLAPAGEHPSKVYHVKAQAITNPIWMDRDGNGRFDPPRAALARKRGAKPNESADVRAAFAAVKEAP